MAVAIWIGSGLVIGLRRHRSRALGRMFAREKEAGAEEKRTPWTGTADETNPVGGVEVQGGSVVDHAKLNTADSPVNSRFVISSAASTGSPPIFFSIGREEISSLAPLPYKISYKYKNI